MNNELGKLIYIEHYGEAKVANRDPLTKSKVGWTKYAKSHKNPKSNQGFRAKAQNVGKKSYVDVKFTRYIKWSFASGTVNVTHNGAKHQHKYWYYDSPKYASGFLSMISDTYASGINKYVNCYFCDSVTGKGSISGAGTFKTPSSVEFSFQDIDVETDDETNKKTVVDVGRGQTGYLKRNRVRDNVIKIEVEWSFLTPSELKKLLSVLSQHGDTAAKSKKYQWINVCFLNPYTNQTDTKKMYVGDRTVSATYNGNYTNLKVSLVQY